MLLYIASVFVPVRILYPIVHIYSSTCISSVQNLGKIGGKTWRKVGGKTWGKLERGGENVKRRGEGWRNVRRLAGRKRGEDWRERWGKL